MISEQELKKICRLAKIEIEQDKLESFIAKFNTIFDWIDKLQKVDVSGVEIEEDDPTLYNQGRQDIVDTHCNHNDVLANADCVKYDMYSVPKVIE